MKHNFMNKENGKVASVLVMYLDDDGHMQTDSYDKVEDLMDDYVAYEQAKPEPLIKDAKKLDTVKSFFTLLGISNKIYYHSINNCFYKTDDDGITYRIDFNDDNGIDNLCTGLPYTIAELCGEKEE